MKNEDILKCSICSDDILENVVGGSALRPHRKLAPNQRYCTGCWRTGLINEKCVCGGTYVSEVWITMPWM